MPRSTDRTGNPPLASNSTRRDEVSARLPPENQQRRSSSWSHYHSRQPSNPFFLSRRAREQGSLRRGRKLVTIDDTLSSREVRDNLGLVAKSDTLHIVGNSEEVVPGTERHVRPFLGRPVGPPPNEKTPFCIGNNSLPELDIIPPTGHNTVRRKVMRTVSQDDYLLARGANPRTGVVTPSIHSESSSIDDQDLFRIRDMSQNARWRLEGDQWISLSLDEPSPLPSSPSETNDRRRGRLLRTPPKLAHGRHPQHGTHVHDLKQHRMDGLTPTSNNTSRLYQTGQQSERGLPDSKGKGNFVQGTTLPARLSPGNHGRPGKDMLIKRKPLGTPPGKQSAENPFRSDDLPEASTETVTTKTGSVEHARSSSMSTPRKIRFFRPEDVGKALPALPGPKGDCHGNMKENPRSRGMTFLGLRKGDWIEDLSNLTRLNGLDAEESLPCPPMKDIQSPFHHSERKPPRALPPSTFPMHTNELENQQRRVIFHPHTEGRSSARPRSRPTIPPRHYQLARMRYAEQKAGQRNPMTIPEASYAKVIHPGPPGQSTSLNAQTTLRRRGADSGSARTSPCTTTPTTTAQTPPEDRLVSSSWREMPSPLRPGRQRANTTSRPAMPERAEGTHNVPQVSPPKELPGRYQWRTTGMSDSEISTSSTSAEGSPERDLIPRPLRPTNGNTADGARLREVAAEGVIDADQATKNCRRCQESSFGSSQPNVHRFTQTQGNQLAENIDPQVDLSFTSSFLQGTPEDHLRCCPECCAVGCHGSCLGHRNPPVTGHTSGFAGSLGVVKEAFRNSMRLSRRIRIRTSAGGSRETETEEVAELETPMSWETGGPVSLGLPSKMTPQSFWAGTHAKDGSQGKRIASNTSASSMKTPEMPTNGGLGAIVEALIVPWGALSMWLKKHPQLLALIQMAAMRLLEMGQHVFDTIGTAYRIAYIYSKTGRISPGKHTSLGGFVRDCAKAVVYCLILGAAAMTVGRVLAVFAEAGSWLIWFLSWVVWIVKAVGLGILW